MAQKTRARPERPDAPESASQQPPAQRGRKLVADTPQVRESGQGIVGMGLRPRGKLTTGRLTRMLRLMALTPTKFNIWTGFTLPQYIRENPSWTERQMFELIQENYEAIDQAVAA